MLEHGRSTPPSTSCTCATSRSATRPCPPSTAAPTSRSPTTATARSTCASWPTAGLNTVHLLPTFDIASIEEERADQAVTGLRPRRRSPRTRPSSRPASWRWPPTDGFNWGYDPYHWMAPEGSYATRPERRRRARRGVPHDGRCAARRRPAGRARRGLQPHLGVRPGRHSVLDKVVPGYYHRLNPIGAVETVHLLPEHRDRARDGAGR